VQTTLPFCRFVMEHEAFRSGQFDTGFVSKYFTPDKLTPAPDTIESELAVVLAAYLLENQKPAQPNSNGGSVQITAQRSKWKANRMG
jgi:acetyl/propionyl-CoA carboxylase alpha subunit